MMRKWCESLKTAEYRQLTVKDKHLTHVPEMLEIFDQIRTLAPSQRKEYIIHRQETKAVMSNHEYFSLYGEHGSGSSKADGAWGECGLYVLDGDGEVERMDEEDEAKELVGTVELNFKTFANKPALPIHFMSGKHDMNKLSFVDETTLKDIIEVVEQRLKEAVRKDPNIPADPQQELLNYEVKRDDSLSLGGIKAYKAGMTLYTKVKIGGVRFAHMIGKNLESNRESIVMVSCLEEFKTYETLEKLTNQLKNDRSVTNFIQAQNCMIKWKKAMFHQRIHLLLGNGTLKPALQNLIPTIPKNIDYKPKFNFTGLSFFERFSKRFWPAEFFGVIEVGVSIGGVRGLARFALVRFFQPLMFYDLNFSPVSSLWRYKAVEGTWWGCNPLDEQKMRFTDEQNRNAGLGIIPLTQLNCTCSAVQFDSPLTESMPEDYRKHKHKCILITPHLEGR
jgi:hypothetical protein